MNWRRDFFCVSLATFPPRGTYHRCQGRKFFSTRVSLYPNSVSTFNLTRLTTSGDINPNPGPSNNGNSAEQCSVCRRTIASNHRAITCDLCNHWCHIKCGGVSPREYQRMLTTINLCWTCPTCIFQLQSLPFANTDNLDSSFCSCCSHDDSNHEMNIFSELLQKYSKNFKIAHLNINSIAGLKLHEIKSWLLRGYFDLLVLTETKLDKTLPNSQFVVDGYRFLRLDRTINGGGVMIYWRADIIFHHITNMPRLVALEAIMIKFKIGRRWLIVIGAYRPPSVRASIWKDELFKLFDCASSQCGDVMLLGDLNCNLLNPDVNGCDGRHLIGICDIYNLDCLIDKPTRVSQSSQSLIDIILTNNKGRFLSSGVFEPHLSDYSLPYAIMRTSAPPLRSRKTLFQKLQKG